MPAPRHYAVLGPLTSAVEARAFLGCEVAAGVPNGDKPVVIVWLPDDITKDAKQIARLQRETAFVTQLVHPNILRVHGLEHFEEGWARIVSFVDGETLQRLSARCRDAGRKIDPRIVARLIIDACEGVHHAHEEGLSRYAGRPIVHGGIRPDTLFVSYDGLTKVTGYGASTISPTQHGGSVRDKYVYLAPEQIIGGKATASPATDIYALGAVLFELLSGRPPFADATDVERAVLTGDPPTLDEPGLLGRLGNIAATALAKRGSERFENVAAMRDAIATALGEEGAASAADVAALLAEIVPPDAPERAHRRSMLESAIDPDSVTMLSRPPGYQPPAPPPRRTSSISAAVALDPAEFGPGESGDELIERVRVARPREEKTIVDGRPPVQAPSPRIREPEPREETDVGQPRSLLTGPVPTISLQDDSPTDGGTAPSSISSARAVEVERRELAELRAFADPVTAEEKPRPVPTAPSLREAPILSFQDGMVTDTTRPVMPPIAARPSVSARLEVDRASASLSAFPEASGPQRPQPVIPPFSASVNPASVLGAINPITPHAQGGLQGALPGSLPPPPFAAQPAQLQAQPQVQPQPTQPSMQPLPPAFAPQPGLGFPQPGQPGSLMPQPGLGFPQPGQPGSLMPQPGLGFPPPQSMFPPQGPGASQPGLAGAPQSLLPPQHPGSSQPGLAGSLMPPGMLPQPPFGAMPPGMQPMPGSMQPQAGMLPPGMQPMPGSMQPMPQGMQPFGSMQPGLQPQLPQPQLGSMQPALQPPSMQPQPQAAQPQPSMRPAIAPSQPVPQGQQGRVAGTQSGLPGPGVAPKWMPGSTGTAPAGGAGQDPLLANQPVRALGAVPRAPMREQSAITRFDRKAGDSSRSTLIVVLGAVAVLLVGIFYFSEPPPEVKEAAQQEVRHNLPKEVVRAALENAKPSEKAIDDEKAAEEARAAAEAAAAAATDKNGNPVEPPDAGPPVEKFGRLELSSDPAVDVYDGNTSLGRTPLTTKLENGTHQLRFTDKNTGLNVYRTYKVKGGSFQRDHLSFGTSELVVEAPDGASVLLNSRFIGKAPLETQKIYEGKYILKVTLDGKSWSDVFDAPPGRRINYKVTLNDTK